MGYGVMVLDATEGKNGDGEFVGASGAEKMDGGTHGGAGGPDVV